MSDKTEHPPLPEAFAKLGVRNSVLKGLAEAQFTTPSEIQALLIPRALAGVDVLGQARTGTGKTAAFGIPLLCKCNPGVGVQAIILVPTRELAVQVEEEIRRLAKHTPLRITSVVGGQKISVQVRHLDHHPEIVVGTPGRVIDLLERRLMSLNDTRFVILDEVDRMLDIGFRDDIRNILARLKKNQGGRSQGEAQIVEVPLDENGQPVPVDPDLEDRQLNEGIQTIFVSATISDEIERLARRYMRGPVEKLIAPGADDKPTVEKIKQSYFTVDPWDKYRLLKMLLDREQPELAIVFCRTKHGAEKLAHQLRADGIECREIHGNLRQSKRDQVMKSFRGGKFEVLVATDLASRGIDVAGISHIVNYDIPEDPEVYVHRVGRTARMGAEGKAFTFISREQGELLDKVEGLINMIVEQDKIEGFVPRPPREESGGAKPVYPGQVMKPATPPGQAPAASSASAAAPATPPRKITLGMKIKRTRRR
ncbi:MAG: DEAD/DEAH box helicase [Tepidisphaeraceae bacterium]